MQWVDWWESHLLPCAYKQLMGVSCPLCGTQRALVSLLNPPIVIWMVTLLVLLLGFPYLQKRHYKIIIAINLLALFCNAVYQNVVF